MPSRSRFESLPAEVLSCILTRCSRDDLVNLAQTHSNMRAVCRKEFINYPLTMNITSDSLKSWVACFHQESTLFTRGARSLAITIAVRMQDLLDAFDDVDPTVFDVDARPIHPDATRVFPLPSSLRKLSLETGWVPGSGLSSDSLLSLLLHPLPEQCPHLEELNIQDSSWHPSDKFDQRILRLTRLRKLHLSVWYLPNIPNRLSLFPASLTDLELGVADMQTQEEVTTTVPWVHGIRKIEFAMFTPQGIANVLMMLSRGDASHLTELTLHEIRDVGIGSCIFPSHLPWPRLQSLELGKVPKMGYQGPLTEPIFPAVTALTIFVVDEIQAPDNLFPALETITWRSVATPKQMTSLIRHDMKRIDMAANYTDDLYESLWKAMGGHAIDLIALQGRLPSWIKRLANNGERIFPGFPNIRDFTIE